MPYIPSALSVRMSITSCLSSCFHRCILLFVFTTDLIYFSMSSFCPLSSCKEIERNVKGSRKGLISASGRLVTQIRRCGSCKPIRSSKSVMTSSRGDDMGDLFGHSSNPSTIRKIGACPGTFNTSFKHWTSSSSRGLRAPSRCVE